MASIHVRRPPGAEGEERFRGADQEVCDQGHDRGGDHALRPGEPEERHDRDHCSDERAHPGCDRGLDRLARGFEAAQFLRAVHLQQRLRVPGQLLGKAVRHFLVDSLQLVEERDLFLLFVGVVDDLLPLSLHVGRRDLSLRALGEVGTRGHRETRGDRPEQACREHEARAPRRAGYAGHDAEHGGEAVVGAVDRAGDPARPGAVPGFAAEDTVEPALHAGRCSISGLMGDLHRLERSRMALLFDADLLQHGVGVRVTR